MTIRRLLAVTHETSHTGAPIMLAGFLEWVRSNHEVEVHTIALTGGPMEERFEEIGPLTILDHPSLATAAVLAERGLQRLGSRRLAPGIAAARIRPRTRRLTGFDLVYLNSFTSFELLDHLPDNGPAVLHVHEMPFALRSYPNQERLELLRTGPAAWVAVCEQTRSMLVDDLAIPAARVHTHHPFVDAASVIAGRSSPADRERLRKRLGIPARARVVMGSGTTDWRKGPELFVQLAAEVRRRSDHLVHFVWVGGDTDGPNWERVRSDIDLAGVGDIHFVGSQTHPFPWFDLADVFALTSHEDPFPLVCQEHALMGHPIVTYRNGGIVDLLGAAGPAAARGIVDHLDVGALADATIAYLDSEALSTAAGNELAERVRTHHDRDVSAAQLWATLEQIAAGTSPTD